MQSLEKMEGFKKLTRIDVALKLAFKECSRVSIRGEVINIEKAPGRILAEDIISQYDVPPYDRASMDGYAIMHEGSFSASPTNPAIFRIIGIAEAGGARKRIGEGETVEIYTGAPMPEGADAVAAAEDCIRRGEEVHVLKPVPKFANVSKQGEDLKKGEVVLRKGRVLRAWDIGVLAAVRIREVAVRAKVRVGVLSTGKELVDISDPGSMEWTSIVDSTKPMLKSLLNEVSCSVIDGGIAPDDVEEIRSRLVKLADEADLLITIGGTSVGRKDLVPEVLRQDRASKLIFHGIAAKPGKPFGFGIFLGKPLFMLPGYPVSALVGYERVVEPVIRSLIGIPERRRRRVKAVIARRVPTTPGLRHFLRVRLEGEGERLVAVPIALTGSGRLSSIANADGIVVIGEDKEGVEEGELVEVELLDG